jgi:hypothetical protein
MSRKPACPRGTGHSMRSARRSCESARTAETYIYKQAVRMPFGR